MLKPTKYLSPNVCVLRAASELVKFLSKSKITKYEEALNYLLELLGEDVRHVFVPSLSFLYLIGKVEYHPLSDSLEFLGQ